MVCLGLEFGASGWFLGADKSTELWRAPKNPLISRRSPDVFQDQPEHLQAAGGRADEGDCPEKFYAGN